MPRPPYLAYALLFGFVHLSIMLLYTAYSGYDLTGLEHPLVLTLDLDSACRHPQDFVLPNFSAVDAVSVVPPHSHEHLQSSTPLAFRSWC
jgi:hypothetical protein